MGVKVAQLYAALGLDKRDYESGLSQAETRSRSWGSRIGGIFKTAGKAIAVGLAVGAVAIGAVAAKGLDAASDLQESTSKVDVVFGKNAEEIKAWAKTASGAFGQSQQQALEAAGTYGNLFQAFGLGRQESTKMSKSLVELAADLASFNNTSVDDALEALRSGLSGETEPLKRFGIALSDARMRTELMAMGFKDLPTVLTPAMKSQAAYSLIMKDSTLAQGDFARTSDGVANQQRIAAAVFQDTMAAIGQAIIPIANMVLPHLVTALTTIHEWVMANMPAIQATIETVVGVIGAVLGFIFREVVPRVIAVLEALFANVQTNMPTIQGIFETVFETISGIIDFTVKNVIPPLLRIFKMVAAWVAANWPTISSVFGQVFGAVANVVRTVWPIVERIATVLFPIVSTAASVLFKALDVSFKLIGGVFEVLGTVARTVVGVIERVWGGLKGFFSGLWNTIGGIIKGGINVVIDAINGLLGFLNNFRIGIPEIGIPGTDVKVGGGYIDPFNIGLIPRLASGGRMTKDGLAWVGEHGPELAYLPGGSRVFPRERSMGMLGGKIEVAVRDPDGAIRAGRYSQADLERAVEAGVRALVGDLRHAGARA